VSGEHPWLLVAPWYRWARQGGPPRETRPVLQKYETSDLVNVFLKDPQHSLKFTDEDRVAVLQSQPAPSGLPKRLSSAVLVRSGTRKLFLDAHKRFYLVVCELHCDVAGLPNANPAEVCETGFVVRRRACNVPQPIRRETAARLQRIAARRARLAQVDRIEPATRIAVLRRPAACEAVARQRIELTRALVDERLQLREFLRASGAVDLVEGWIPSSLDKVGSWQAVSEDPQVVSESIFPLLRLIPDPRADHHAAAGRAMYYGLVATASADTDSHGHARFDDASCYEIRCFVRRHDPRCPRTGERNDCKGELVWSEPTEIYRIASHFDLDGTSNRPVTIQLPDIPALTAQAAALPVKGPQRAKAAPVKMVTPAGSKLNIQVSGGLPTGGTLGGPGFCHLSIPLITIVATFVFQLFLPIVVLIFGLWALLKLRFCIPPEISISAGVTAELHGVTDVDLQLPSVELSVALGTIKTGLNAGGTDTSNHGVGDRMLGPPPVFGADALADFADSVSVNLAAAPAADDPPEGPPLADAPWGEGDPSLEWEEEVAVA
jgi:hypothetical protein